MKRCPSCEKVYPDSETYCEADGTALVESGPAFAEGAEEQATECPVCGGKAQPGELICNFCGARLGEPGAPERVPVPPTPPPPSPPATSAIGEPSPSARLTGEMPEEVEEESGGRGIFGIAGYLIAALIALVGGAWLAIHLSSRATPPPVAEASPSALPSPMAAGPIVALASTMGVQVTGESAAAPERNQETARKVFEDKKAALLSSYSRALAGDSTFRDAMVVRLRVVPNGTVEAASVRTSTNPNPGFDAEVVKDLSSWSFAPFSGGSVEVDYPVIFTNDPSARDALESALSSKVASLSPTEAPEYSSAQASPSPVAAAETPPAAIETPVAVAPPPRPKRTVRREVPRPRPTPTLQQRVKEVLASNSKLRRVDCYTSGGTVTIFGKVFDANDKALAAKVVRQVPGVGNVINSLTTDESDWAANQARIAQQLANAGLDKVTVKVIGHDAYLNGSVKTAADKQRAVLITQSAAPVKVRSNIITVEPGRVFGF